MRPFVSLVLTETLMSGLLLNPGAAHAQTAEAITPIQHLVVIFQENVSFDHYFGTYPNATNPPGEPAFKALPDTPSVNGLSGALLTNNPNLNAANGPAPPIRSASTARRPPPPIRTTTTRPNRWRFTAA